MPRLILFSIDFDSFTDRIIDWLRFYHPDIRIVRVNKIDDLNKISVENKDLVIIRRIRHLYDRSSVPMGDLINLENVLDILKVKSDDEKLANLEASFFLEVGELVFGNFIKKAPNKLIQMKLASNRGLEIPKYIVTDDKRILKKFVSDTATIGRKVITKPMTDVFSLSYESQLYSVYSTLIDNSIVEKLPKKFHISLFQHFISCEYEVRVFYWENKFYGMAMFTQSNFDVENVDYRKNRQLKVRRVPYNLPENIKQKVMLLMEDLNLSTGSIDFLKSNDGNYYFLEVNPEGQIGMVSNLCNYDIEHKIVKKINV